MKQMNLAIWPLFKPKPEEQRLEPQKEWNQEEESFRNGSPEAFEHPREKLQRLALNLGDLKKLVF